MASRATAPEHGTRCSSEQLPQSSPRSRAEAASNRPRANERFCQRPAVNGSLDDRTRSLTHADLPACGCPTYVFVTS